MLRKLNILFLGLVMSIAMVASVSASSGPGSEVHGGPIATPAKGSIDAGETRVAIFAGDWWTDDLWSYLDGLPDVSCDRLTAWPGLAVVREYDVVILYGNASYIYTSDIFNQLDQYVDEGGGLIGTPWFLDWSLSSGLSLNSLPVSELSHSEEYYHTPLDITVIDTTDPLLEGVSFNPGDDVGYEGEMSAKGGASVSVQWNDAWNTPAVTRWDYGSGRSVYLNFHYITSDCGRAIDYPWGKQLIYNSVVWSARPGPTIDIVINQTSFTTSQTLIAKAKVTGGAEAEVVEVKIWIHLPGSSLISIQNIPKYTVPAGASFEVTVFNHHFGGSEPPGEYDFGGRFLNWINGDYISTDVESFTFTP